MRESVRTALDDAILYIYREIRYPVFPLDPSVYVRRVARCRYITYDDLARVSGTGYKEVVNACRSVDGCTQYEPTTGRYLVAINTSDQYSASKSRVRWTTAHELGHIAAGHFVELYHRGADWISPSEFSEMEEEADYFAASFLAPIPAINMLRVKKPADIRDWFGLSQTAAEYRWADLRRQQADERLEDHFLIFRPRSVVKDGRALKGIDVRMDSWETC